jgi:hypothetical protein
MGRTQALEWALVDMGEREVGDNGLVWAEGDQRRDGHDLAIVCLGDLPVVLMDHSVMPMAKKCQVVEIGGPAMDPVDEMVCIAP